MKNIEIEIRIILEDNSVIDKWLNENAKYLNQSFQHECIL